MQLYLCTCINCFCCLFPKSQMDSANRFRVIINHFQFSIYHTMSFSLFSHHFKNPDKKLEKNVFLSGSENNQSVYSETKVHIRIKTE